MSELDPKWEAMCLAEVEKWRGMRFSERNDAPKDFMWRVAAGLELESAALRARLADVEACLAESDRRLAEAQAQCRDAVVELQRLKEPPAPPKPAIEIPKCWNPPPGRRCEFCGGMGYTGAPRGACPPCTWCNGTGRLP